MLQQLKDMAGRAVKALSGVQTDEAKFGHLPKHLSDHPTRGLTPQKLARIFTDAEQGYLIAQCELAEDIEEKDGHIYAELQKRKRALLSVNWNIKPPRDASDAEIADAQMIEDALQDATWLEDAILDMADAILKGFSNLELEWGTVGTINMPIAAHHRDSAWFQTHPDDRNQLRLRDNSYEGAELQPFGWISHIHKAKSGYIGRAGLVRILAWPFLFKNLSARDLAEFLEIYGIPVRVGRYPRGSSDKEKASLMKAVLSIGHNAAGIMPQGMEMEFQEASKGASDPFMAMINWCEKTQSKAILGGTLTSQADGKSSTNALGNVHNDVRVELRDSDLKQLAATLTRDLVYPIYARNGRSFSGPHRIPRFEFDTSEPEDLAVYADNLPKLVEMGMRIPLDYAHDKLMIPKAADDEAVLQRAAASSPIADLKMRSHKAALKAENKGPESTADKQATQLDEMAGQQIDLWLDQVRALLDEVDSLEDLAEKLLELYPEMEVNQLGEVLAEAFAAGHMAGRFDVMEGN